MKVNRPKKVDPHARSFGVEIECGIDGGYRRVAELFKFPMADFGRYDYRNHSEGWTLGSDGSGVELRTPIMSGQSGFDKLRGAMLFLKENGAYVTRSDGMHVHHDAPEFIGNAEACLQLVKSWRNNQDAIDSLVAPRRRMSGSSYGHCPKWGNSDFDALERLAKGEADYLDIGRRDLNLSSMDAHGSIEIRLHEGTLDPEVAIAWIKFGQRLLHTALQRSKPLATVSEGHQLMTRIRLPQADRIALERKRNAGFDTSESGWVAR